MFFGDEVTSSTHLVVDVLGYYSPEANDVNGVGLLFTPLPAPVRLLETRAGQPVGCYLPAAPLLAVIAGLAPAHSRSVAVALLMVTINVVGLGGGPLFVGWLSDMLQPAYGKESLGMAMRWSLVVGGPSLVLSWLASRACREDFARAGGWDHSARPATPAH